MVLAEHLKEAITKKIVARFFISQNIYDYGLVLDDIKYISKEVQMKMKGTIVEANDVLFNINGGSIENRSSGHMYLDFIYEGKFALNTTISQGIKKKH